ncbi:MAG: hypothetical protein VYC36_03440 [Pseudomonadota bacterium]|uniref:Uncharacterized protein n=1 Tax=marine metagenome TaxID=408172 RepID=A0A381PS23_9ZZZZ|nr:hypothetical protein [Pseudomonadota bacterium]MEC9239945.1 hypothetical protein [Pseudomonadota bacterium]MEC9285007.1 hypothetical protein [Pseudomonadota bacterium]
MVLLVFFYDMSDVGCRRGSYVAGGCVPAKDVIEQRLGGAVDTMLLGF